jgi:hypothetical protein
LVCSESYELTPTVRTSSELRAKSGQLTYGCGLVPGGNRVVTLFMPVKVSRLRPRVPTDPTAME